MLYLRQALPAEKVELLAKPRIACCRGALDICGPDGQFPALSRLMIFAFPVENCNPLAFASLLCALRRDTIGEMWLDTRLNAAHRFYDTVGPELGGLPCWSP
jgi:hypothetical protein